MLSDRLFSPSDSKRKTQKKTQENSKRHSPALLLQMVGNVELRLPLRSRSLGGFTHFEEALAALLLDDAVTVGVEKVFQLGDLAAQLFALVGVGDKHAVGGHLDDLGGALDVGAAEYGVLGRGERLMLHELEASAVVDEGVACDARLLVVCL